MTLTELPVIAKYLITFFISMVPLIELRGAIPVAKGLGLPIVPAIAVSAVGNMLPVPVIYFFAQKVLLWGMDKPLIGGFCRFCHDKGIRAGEKLSRKSGRGLLLALLLFVGIPLPGTGAWTGTLGASILGMKGKDTTIAVSLGVLLASAIVTAVTLAGFNIFTG